MTILDEDHGFRVIDFACSEIFKCDSVLPGPVFTSSLSNYCWIEFEFVLTSEFAELLRQCSHRSGDQRIWVICDEPYPQDNFGHSGVAELSGNFVDDDYHEFLDRDMPSSRSISVRHIGSRLLFIGDSRLWAFYANRTVELAVGAQK